MSELSSLVILLWLIPRWSSVLADSEEHQLIPLAQTCNRVAIPSQPDQYLEVDHIFWHVHHCAPYTTFDQSACDCVFNYFAFTTPQPTLEVPRRPQPLFNIIPLLLANSLKVQNPPPSPVRTTTTTTTTTTRPFTTQPTTTRRTTTATTTTTTLKPVVLLFEKNESGEAFKHKDKTTPPSSPKPNRLCDGCVFDRGVGYLQHKDDCNKYVMCYAREFQGHVTGEVRMCGVGKYWDQTHLTCKPTHMVQCEHDPCRLDSALVTYRYGGDCRAYWRCVRGTSVGVCCPPGHAYKAETHTCSPAATCTSTACDNETIVKDCDKVPDPDDPGKFRQEVPGHGHVTMRCATGTVFNQDSCSCDQNIRTTRMPKDKCVKELEMDFTHSLTETSGHGLHVESVNVTWEAGSACFHGNSALIIPRFSNVEVGANLNVYVRYKINARAATDDLSQAPQALVYNGDCGQDSSIVILTSDHVTSFSLRNNFNVNTTVELSQKKEADVWHDATFTFHNNMMKISEDGRSVYKYFPGHVDRSRCGLKIGWGQDYKSFHGCIDHISVSFCPAVQ